MNSDKNGRYYLLNAKVPGNWFWNFESGVCAGHGDSNDFYKGNVLDLVCTVTVSSSFAYGYASDGTPVYTGGGDKLVDGANQNLYPGDCRTSAEGMTQLCYQGDGNLVLYDNGPAVWASNTDGTSANTAVMQGDGNFVVYDADWIPVWDSGTYGHSGAFLSVQNDGCALIYESDGNTVLWGTGTCRG